MTVAPKRHLHREASRLWSGLALRLWCISLGIVLLSCGASRDAASANPGDSPRPAGAESVVAAESAAGSRESPSVSGAVTEAAPATALPVPAFSNAESIGGIVEFLASDSLKGRDTGSEGLEAAAQFLENRMREYGIQPFYETYRDTLSNSKDVAYNIVGVIPGSDPALSNEIVLLGAHYDHIGIVPIKNGDGIANGANDNASGTATVLELARFLAGAEAPRRSVVFAFFSAEERGLLGSRHLAQRMQADSARLYAVLNFEMTGVPMKGKTYQMYLTGYNKSNMAEVSNRYGGADLVGYLPQASEYNLFQRSDNYSFYELMQVPAHTFSTFDFENYAYYHQAGDEAGEMDFEHMARLVNRMIPVVRGIASGPGQELKLN